MKLQIHSLTHFSVLKIKLIHNNKTCMEKGMHGYSLPERKKDFTYSKRYFVKSNCMNHIQ